MKKTSKLPKRVRRLVEQLIDEWDEDWIVGELEELLKFEARTGKHFKPVPRLMDLFPVMRIAHPSEIKYVRVDG